MRMPLTVPLISLVLFAGCATHRAATGAGGVVDTEAEARRLMERSRAWSAAVASGDLEEALAYWGDDAVVMAPGQPPIRGREAIRAYVTAAGQIPGFRISWEPLEAHVSASGDMAYMLERNTISMADGAGGTVTEHNKVVTVWRRGADGVWRNVVDAWNADPSGGR